MIDVIILAAGKGTRMKSPLPKVLNTIGGKPMVEHVIDSTKSIDNSRIHVIVGHGAAHLEERLAGQGVNIIHQEEQLGTGHAVQTALPQLQPWGVSLILYGDVPLISSNTLKQLIKLVDENSLALLTVHMDDPTGYGRIVRDRDDNVVAIVEHKDANAGQLAIHEINTGIMAVNNEDLNRYLPKLENNNIQGEFYLTDLIAMSVAEGKSVRTTEPDSPEEVLGVNNRNQQAELERYYQFVKANQLLDSGTHIFDPNRIDVRGELICGADVSIDVNCVFIGKVSLGNNVKIEPNCVIENCEIGDNTVIKAFSHLVDSKVETGCDVGPYARLRPGTELAANVKIGNFVEVKKSTIAEGSKVNHLSYVGDAEIGTGVNIGAGTITCNYDGVNKHKTTIGDDVFIGSNTALVAPVTVNNQATIGAGSTITKDVPEDNLAVTRSDQVHRSDWQRPVKQKKEPK
ncbi:bifunctional UDP-N-acetylglucosamine diphosphorylase/glucosamine-1-phosphate N-acetyltransferase GlmU [Sessilibacter corallicola]|uniref:bifunctional UDP-N-acetylglucosamine diphosphorylase/glucosamine-1-phosphate N-acetyltransferase GlmU n=1 Tax=Sessilibacter corallicola TaxID=2904075 RepID=UPI001E3B2DCC|nr:bifunctional UDP-N-acetylglucosamine diphosphorylase/glucosamine-1-phosphate N-acetyltransferase GlmU [Sessilibacter corallicola]MCE2028019.1 bifunctional UDP-N-acetylglucosamine diphosphorylase/glucosamine-1-phosphate N-acetyltransferase GlmU [Sessilibacter corallicola]